MCGTCAKLMDSSSFMPHLLKSCPIRNLAGAHCASISEKPGSVLLSPRSCMRVITARNVPS